MTRKFDTREAWLNAAVEGLTEYMRDRLGMPIIVPEIYVSVGFPGGGQPRKRIGECWRTTSSADKKNHVFVSPILGDPIDVLATLLHELVHVWDDNENGHTGLFVRTIRKLGLEGKPTATVAGEALTELLTSISEALGEYPHSALNLGTDVKIKKQTTRMLKVVCESCTDDEGNAYVVRMTRKWLDTLGEPVCPGCETQMVEC